MSANSSNRSRTVCMRCAFLTLAVLGLMFGTACDEEEAFRAFREASSTSVQTGMNSIADGFIDGLFAVFDQGIAQTADSTSDTTTSGS